MKIATVARLLAVLLIASPACGAKHVPVLDLDIHNDCSFTLDGKYLATEQLLHDELTLLAKRTPKPEINFVPNKNAKYDCVAKVLADFQRFDFYLGFVGNEQP